MAKIRDGVKAFSKDGLAYHCSSDAYVIRYDVPLLVAFYDLEFCKIKKILCGKDPKKESEINNEEFVLLHTDGFKSKSKGGGIAFCRRAGDLFYVPRRVEYRFEAKEGDSLYAISFPDVKVKTKLNDITLLGSVVGKGRRYEVGEDDSDVIFRRYDLLGVGTIDRICNKQSVAVSRRDIRVPEFVLVHKGKATVREDYFYEHGEWERELSKGNGMVINAGCGCSLGLFKDSLVSLIRPHDKNGS